MQINKSFSRLAKEKKAVAKKAQQDPLNKLIVDTILDKKGYNVTLMDLRDLSGPTDYFILCEADNITLTKALAGYIEKSVKEQYGILPKHIEGLAQAKWVLVDYFTTVVHIFYKETRAYYELDSLWSDAKVVEFHQM